MGVRGQPQTPATSTPGKEAVPILQEAGWAPGPVWTGVKSRPHRDSIPDCPARSQSLYRLRWPMFVIAYSIERSIAYGVGLDIFSKEANL